MELKEGQVVEVEYDKALIEKDIKAQEENDQELIVQDIVNEDGIDELVGEGAEIVHEQENE